MAGELPHRKRMKRIEAPRGVRFVTFSCQRRLPLMSQPAVCRTFLGSMAHVREAHGLSIYAWVLMPEHVHILMMPGRVPLDRSLLALKLSVSKREIARWREVKAPILREIEASDGRPRMWQKGGGHDRNVRDGPEFRRKVQYIHRNPVERGLVERPEDWRWSSVRWWMGVREGEFACDPPPWDATTWDGWTGYV